MDTVSSLVWQQRLKTTSATSRGKSTIYICFLISSLSLFLSLCFPLPPSLFTRHLAYDTSHWCSESESSHSSSSSSSIVHISTLIKVGDIAKCWHPLVALDDSHGNIPKSKNGNHHLFFFSLSLLLSIFNSNIKSIKSFRVTYRNFGSVFQQYINNFNVTFLTRHMKWCTLMKERKANKTTSIIKSHSRYWYLLDQFELQHQSGAERFELYQTWQHNPLESIGVHS